jgi:hypothetical protein
MMRTQAPPGRDDGAWAGDSRSLADRSAMPRCHGRYLPIVDGMNPGFAAHVGPPTGPVVAQLIVPAAMSLTVQRCW